MDEPAFGCAGEDPPDRRPPPTGAPGAAGPEPATVAVCGTAGGPDVTGAGAAGTGADETGPGTVTGGAGTVTGGADTVTGGADTVTGGADTVTGGADTVTDGTVAVTVETGGGVTATVVTGVDSVTVGSPICPARLPASTFPPKNPATARQQSARRPRRVIKRPGLAALVVPPQ